MTAKRIYKVMGGEWPRLVLASSQAQAINHCVRGTFSATVASQMDIVEVMSDSSRSIVGVEDAGDPDE